MASILHNMHDYIYDENINLLKKSCICCTSQNGVLVDLKTCKHTAFFDHLQIKFPLKYVYICNICHNMLKKIDIFKQQVKESVALLLDQAPILKKNRLHNLKTTCIEIDGITIPLEIKTEKIEIEIQEITADMKVEYDSDSKLEAEPTPNKNLGSEEKYKGKIKVVILSKEDVYEEREKMAKNKSYVKMPFKCDDCIMGFYYETTLKAHIENRHKMKKNSFQCDICKTVLSSKNSYTNHVNRHGRRLECAVCGNRYNHTRSALQHYNEKHGDGTPAHFYTCNICAFTTPSHRIYRYHMDKHKSKQECKICGSTFVNKSGLKVHMYTVHEQRAREFPCETCGKVYRARSGIIAHMKSAAHAGDDARAFCTLCKTHYKTQQGLLFHLNTHSKHVGDDKRFICDDCGAKFLSKSSLRAHINWEHLKIIKHRCTECPKVYRSNSALKVHIKYVHLKKRLPRDKICDYCGRAFTTQTMLKYHIRTHTGERPLQCTFCPANFAHSAALYNHKKLLHTAKK